jgi:hypothetical protein
MRRKLMHRIARLLLGNEYVSTECLQAALSRVDELEKHPVEKTVYGIHRDTYNKLVVQKLENTLINNSTTPHQVGYLLGIQRALRVVEQEIVIA